MMMKKNKAKNIGESKKIEFSIIIIINKKTHIKLKSEIFLRFFFFFWPMVFNSIESKHTNKQANRTYSVYIYGRKKWKNSSWWLFFLENGHWNFVWKIHIMLFCYGLQHSFFLGKQQNEKKTLTSFQQTN